MEVRMGWGGGPCGLNLTMLACELVQVNGHCKLLALRVGKQVGRWMEGLGVGGEEAWRDTRGT
jgi:hypothetical protein